MKKMKKMKKQYLITAILALSLAAAGCSAATAGTSSSDPSGSESISSDMSYDESSSDTIELSDSDGKAEITEGGTYIITGSTSDGMITVSADKDEEVILVLRDVSISSSDSAPIFVSSADRLYITLEGDNTLSNGGAFDTVDGEEIDSVIYCKTDLIIGGTGTLGITSPSGHAIVCKDNMTISGGTFDITSGEDGINTNDSLTISDGTFDITSGDDAVHTDGTLLIDSGTFNISAAEGLEGTVVIINDGDITISASDDGINAAQKSDELSPYVEINGGTIDITMGAGDTDGIDSNGDIIINGGVISINGQSTCDYDGKAELNGGTLILNGEESDTIPNQFAGGEGFPGKFPGNGELPEGFDPSSDGGFPGGDRPQGGELPEGFEPPEGDPPQGMPGGKRTQE